MASIITGSIVSEIRGSVGSEAYSRNAFGPYVKARVSPTNPNTAPQIAARAVITAAVAAWKSLTDTQRMVYIVQARQRSLINRIGIKTRVTGYNLFIRQFQLSDRLGVGSETTIVSPQLNGIYKFESITPTAGSLLLDIFNPNILSSGHLSVYASDGRSAGQMSFNPSTARYLQISTPVNGSSQIDLTTPYQAIFGMSTPLVGERISVGINTSKLESSELTETLYLSELVAA